LSDHLKEYEFQKGMEKVPGSGRKPGTRNRLSHAFIEAFAADFEQHGTDVIKIVRMEKPHEYLKTAAYLMPKTFDPDAPAVLVVRSGVPRHGDEEPQQIPAPAAKKLPPPEPKIPAVTTRAEPKPDEVKAPVRNLKRPPGFEDGPVEYPAELSKRA
jgi:hypothetical protein